MIITKELLRRFHEGLCTEEERRAVERWLSTPDDIPAEVDLDATRIFEESRESVWAKITDMQSELTPSSREGEPRKVIPLHRRVSRYAAVACIIIGIFAAGFSTGFTFAKPSVDTVKQSKQLITSSGLLHIYGGNGVYGVVTEDHYRVEFEGRLALYNEAQHSKRIVCGEQEFTLEPRRTYYLSGSHRQAILVIDEDWGMDTYWGINTYSGEQPELVGDFSFLRLD
ncbi:MAG: hypothetical protein AAF632_26675 [Bacteroidota bacterium]